MNPIESKHHLKSDEFHEYREGVVLNRPVKDNATGSWVDIGLHKQAKIDYKLQPSTRVTVKLNETSLEHTQKCISQFFEIIYLKLFLIVFTGNVVSQLEPQKTTSLYL